MTTLSSTLILSTATVIISNSIAVLASSVPKVVDPSSAIIVAYGTLNPGYRLSITIDVCPCCELALFI